MRLLRGPLLLSRPLQAALFLQERFFRDAQELAYGIVEPFPFGVAGNVGGW